MSWQRIDDNTFIDDTLVTCTEYQLFIDEMREQGKHYQPDHWTSYQFPKGQAHEPVLGVRSSDAIEFCDWLTDQDRSWWYRLPHASEISQFRTRIATPSVLGYWIIDVNETCHIEWANITMPTNARNLDSMVISSRIGSPNLIPETVVARSQNRCLNFKFDIREIVDIERQDLLQLAIAMVKYREFATRLRKNNNRHRLSLEIALECLFDVVTLQERIAGRSPAFEGIRLVKERIK